MILNGTAIECVTNPAHSHSIIFYLVHLVLHVSAIPPTPMEVEPIPSTSAKFSLIRLWKVLLIVSTLATRPTNPTLKDGLIQLTPLESSHLQFFPLLQNNINSLIWLFLPAVQRPVPHPHHPPALRTVIHLR